MPSPGTDCVRVFWPRTEARRVRHGVQLLDLPNEILVEIIGQMDSFSDIGRSRAVCWRFHAASTTVLQAAYRKFEMELAADIRRIRLRRRNTWSQVDQACSRHQWALTEGLDRLTKVVLYLETLHTCLALANAAAGPYVRHRGGLLDDFRRAHGRVMAVAADALQPSPLAPVEAAVWECRHAAASHILQIADWLGRNCTKDDGCRLAVLGGVSLIQTLMLSVDSARSAPLLARHAGTDLVTVSAHVRLRKCWFGLHATADYRVGPAARRLLEAVRVLRELVWASNHEAHTHDEQRSRLAPETGLVEAPLLMRACCQLQARPGAIVHGVHNVLERTYEVIDVGADRVLFYGHASRVPELGGPEMGDALAGLCQPKLVRLGGKVVGVPVNYNDGVLVVIVEVTCAERDLPPELLAAAREGPEQSAGTKARPFVAVEISSFKDELEAPARMYCFSVEDDTDDHRNDTDAKSRDNADRRDPDNSEDQQKPSCLGSVRLRFCRVFAFLRRRRASRD